MKKIKPNEMYNNVSGFLKTKGIVFEEGTYTQRVQSACRVLTDAINLTQDAVKKTKTKVDDGLDQIRQKIHEKTAPKPPVSKPKAPVKKRSSKMKAKRRTGVKAQQEPPKQ